MSRIGKQQFARALPFVLLAALFVLTAATSAQAGDDFKHQRTWTFVNDTGQAASDCSGEAARASPALNKGWENNINTDVAASGV